jgi:hypothetical protein
MGEEGWHEVIVLFSPFDLNDDYTVCIFRLSQRIYRGLVISFRLLRMVLVIVGWAGGIDWG